MEDRIFTKIFLIIWSIIWVFILIKIWNILKWRMFGYEIIIITQDKLVLEERIPFKIKEYAFKLSEICISKYNYQNFESENLFNVHPGTINIENHNHCILTTFGKYLTSEEIITIEQELQLHNIKVISRDTSSVEKASIADTDKSSKKHIMNFQKKIFLICLLPAVLYGYFHFKNKNESENEIYNRLKAKGIITIVNSNFQEHWDADYYYFYFVTDNGQKIEKSGKCGNKETFNKDYKNLNVIYNPSNPKEFMEYPKFQIYSTSFPVFWLIILSLFYSLSGSVIIVLGCLVISGQFKLLINK